MKILPRTQFGNPILRSKAKKVSYKFFKTIKGKKLIKSMIYTMRRDNGVGLAAPQIGQPLSIAVMEMRPSVNRPKLKHKGPIVVVNPRILKHSKNKINGWEGCLSLRAIRAMVPRSKTITVEYYNENGKKITEEATGFWARIFQHEIDHLNGLGYIDRIENTKTIMMFSEYKKRVLKKK
jgi:peptide deformylase